MARGVSDSPPICYSCRDTADQQLLKEGVAGMWRGVCPTAQRSAIVAGVQLPVYDFTRKHLSRSVEVNTINHLLNQSIYQSMLSSYHPFFHPSINHIHGSISHHHQILISLLSVEDLTYQAQESISQSINSSCHPSINQ